MLRRQTPPLPLEFQLLWAGNDETCRAPKVESGEVEAKASNGKSNEVQSGRQRSVEDEKGSDHEGQTFL